MNFKVKSSIAIHFKITFFPSPAEIQIPLEPRATMTTFRKSSITFLLIPLVFTANTAKDVEVQFLPINGVDGHHENAPNGHHTAVRQGGHGALPLEQFMKMFPLDMPGTAHVKVIHLGPKQMANDPVGDMIGDQIINAILSELSAGFHKDTKPLIQGVHSALREEPHPCISEIAKFCQEGHDHGHKHQSELHCLGLHADEISEACASEVQKSLPFVCSFEISRYCSSKHTIDKSVLQCLEDQLDKGFPMDTECRDSVGATRSVLNKMKTQNVALVNRRTGEIIRGPLSYVSTSIYIGLYCLGFFILGVLLYSFWVRDDETGLLKSIQKTLRELRVAGRSKGPMRVSTMEMKDGFNRSL